MTETRIRASYTSSYPDCTRRGAARMFENEIKAQGYELRRLPPNIGAVTGTATHAAVYWALAEKITTGELGNETESEQRALESLRLGTAEGVMWDAVTTTMSTAQRQVLRQAKTYRQNIAVRMTPVLVETRIEATVGNGIIVSGQIDAYGDMDGQPDTLLGDLKTGKMLRWNAPQYGTYTRLLRTDGRAPKRIEEHFVPRVPLDQEQPRPEIIPYDIGTAERASAAIIKRIGADLAEFRQTGNPDTFIANPMSMLCSDKFCSAWGTAWCRNHRGAR